MMVMASNHSSRDYIELCKKHPGKLGWLMGPAHYKFPRGGVPFALDNDAFSAWKNGSEWDEPAWFRFCDKVARSEFSPLWALVPDVVADRQQTIDRWHKYSPVVRSYGWETAFAVQDGMTPDDVPEDADVVFVGGTTEWKWKTVAMWAKSFDRVHVGRVATTRLHVCERLGVESCDGTSWFRETMNGRPARKLIAWLEGCNQQHEFAFT